MQLAPVCYNEDRPRLEAVGGGLSEGGNHGTREPALHDQG